MKPLEIFCKGMLVTLGAVMTALGLSIVLLLPVYKLEVSPLGTSIGFGSGVLFLLVAAKWTGTNKQAIALWLINIGMFASGLVFLSVVRTAIYRNSIHLVDLGYMSTAVLVFEFLRRRSPVTKRRRKRSNSSVTPSNEQSDGGPHPEAERSLFQQIKNSDDWPGAAQRAQRRRSPWNLLLLALVLSSVVLIEYVMVYALLVVSAVVSSQPAAFLSRSELVQMGVAASLLIPALLLGMIAGNFLVHLFPPARRALDEEAMDDPRAGFRSAQRQLWVVARYAIPVFILVGLLVAVFIR